MERVIEEPNGRVVEKVVRYETFVEIVFTDGSVLEVLSGGAGEYFIITDFYE